MVKKYTIIDDKWEIKKKVKVYLNEEINENNMNRQVYKNTKNTHVRTHLTKE